MTAPASIPSSTATRYAQVLVPLDFSTLAWRSVSAASVLARGFGVPYRLAHIDTSSPWLQTPSQDHLTLRAPDGSHAHVEVIAAASAADGGHHGGRLASLAWTDRSHRAAIHRVARGLHENRAYCSAVSRAEREAHRRRPRLGYPPGCVRRATHRHPRGGRRTVRPRASPGPARPVDRGRTGAWRAACPPHRPIAAQLVLGSTSKAVLRHATFPVLVRHS